MIYDTINNLWKYNGISANLDKAIDFILGTDLDTLPLGRNEIDGDSVFVNVMEVSAKNREELQFEMHRAYMDIQIDVVGTEIIDLGYGELTVLEEMDVEKDYGFVLPQESVPCRMGPGKFVVCMSGEAHKPGIQGTEDPFVKKCVVKVAVKERNHA